MTYKLAICDDEPSVIEYVSSIVTDWANEYHYDIQLRIFSSAESFDCFQLVKRFSSSLPGSVP